LSSPSDRSFAVLGENRGFIIVMAAGSLVLLFGADIKLAGSLSLAVSLPTHCCAHGRGGWRAMIVGFARYSQRWSALS